MNSAHPLVLLVEDSPDDVRIALRALGRMEPPPTVEVVRDGMEALEALGLEGPEAKRAYDLVLCDLKLPFVRGDEILRRVRGDERLKGLPFVVFSSSSEREDVARCEALGVSEYATKPVDLDAYNARITGLVRRHLPG